MSLNKFTDALVKKDWMNINCNQIVDTKLVNVPSASGSFYESYETKGNLLSGPWAAPLAAEYKVTKVGNMVTINVPLITATASVITWITLSELLPVELRPSTQEIGYVNVQDNNLFAAGRLVVNPSGSVLIYAQQSSSNFQGAGVTGPIAGSISYLL